MCVVLHDYCLIVLACFMIQ